MDVELTLYSALHAFFVLRDSGVLASIEDLLRPRTCQFCHRDLKAMWDAKVENQNAWKTGDLVAPPVHQANGVQASTPAPASELVSESVGASTSPSNFTTPRQSTDYDAETLRSVDATIRLV